MGRIHRQIFSVGRRLGPVDPTPDKEAQTMRNLTAARRLPRKLRQSIGSWHHARLSVDLPLGRCSSSPTLLDNFPPKHHPRPAEANWTADNAEKRPIPTLHKIGAWQQHHAAVSDYHRAPTERPVVGSGPRRQFSHALSSTVIHLLHNGGPLGRNSQWPSLRHAKFRGPRPSTADGSRLLETLRSSRGTSLHTLLLDRSF